VNSFLLTGHWSHPGGVPPSIDDTIKITEIPAGGKVVVKNTFFRDFVVAPEMANRYKNLGNASFHYVSGTPWQLYRPLSNFIKEEGFPEGSFHMKSVPKNLLSLTTSKQLFKLIGDATVDQKVAQLVEILERFPEREFLFVGDSGEHDPEVYSQLRNTFGDQIKEIWIRDVVNERNTNPDRLHQMRIIEA
jgi:phosphatidate phosphatase APP1